MTPETKFGLLIVFAFLLALLMYACGGCSEVQVLPLTVEQRYEPVPTPEFVTEATVRA